MIPVHDHIHKFDLLPPGTYIAGTLVEDCEDAWNELSPTGCTITAGTANKVVGTNCVKIVMDASAAVGIIAAEVISSLDLSLCKFVSFYIMCTRGVLAGDLQLLLDETAQCASPSETLDIPEIKAGVMNYVVLPFAAAAAERNAIISVGLKMARDLGACDVYIDHVQAWTDQPLTGIAIDMNPYAGDAKLVLDVAKVVAGTTKTCDVAIQESEYPYSGFAAMTPALAFTQVTTNPAGEAKQLMLEGKKRYVRAVVTLGSSDASYALALHGYAQQKYEP